MRYIVIMAGGSGTRLWPLSRRGMPKQLLRLLGGRSLLRLAYDRVAGTLPDAQILVCTGQDYLDQVAAELPELPPENLLGEPVGRDSLNAVSWPAALLAGRDPDAVVAMLSSDHVIHPVRDFAAALDTAFVAAETDPQALVTLGVVPTHPHTGFGYLHRGDPLVTDDPRLRDVYALRGFTEKPDYDTAEQYVESGEYWWNSGMFVWRAATMLDQLHQLLPDQHALITRLAAHPDELAEIYPQLPRISIDYSVLEPVAAGRGTAHLVAVRLPITWHDVGGYPALKQQLHNDRNHNAAIGPSVIVDGRGNLLINTTADRTIAVVGLDDTVVVQTEDVTMVCPLRDADRTKELVAEVTRRLGDRFA